jgi:hypothetical protein
MPPGWPQLLHGFPWFRGEGCYPIAAYSEFMPPAHLGRRPYGTGNPFLLSEDDPWGWAVTEYQEIQQIRPGLENIGRQIVNALVHLGEGRFAHGVSRNKLADNPYWPAELAEHAGKLKHERYVVLLPLALSRTLDDKGRLRWTLFGGSEQGPSRAFWKSFFTGPANEVAAEEAVQFFRRLLRGAYDRPAGDLDDLHQAGFRILPAGKDSLWPEGPLPRWTRQYLLREREPAHAVKYLLTFLPFGKLPHALRKAYLAGDLHLLPFPGSLVFWGVPTYLELARVLPLAAQIPLLHMVARHEEPHGIRVPQSGWLHEPRPNQRHPERFYGPVRNTYQRTHRWARVHRHEDELVTAKEDKLAHVLFSAAADDLGLYGKPMARNVQLWTHDFRLLLDGPRASPAEIQSAAQALAEGGIFGYRFVFPAMRLGRHEVYWQRPLAAFWSKKAQEAVVLADPLLGYLTAYAPAESGRPVDRHVELWPRILHRQAHVAALHLFDHPRDPQPYRTSLNVRKLLNACSFFDGRLPRTFARQLLTLPKGESLSGWVAALPERANDPDGAHLLASEIRRVLEPPGPGRRPRHSARSLTFARTARRAYEVRYWKRIAALAAGKYINKDNADCVNDPHTREVLRHHHRDLEALGDYLLRYYHRLIRRKRMTAKALVGDLPFRWQTDFAFTWSDGWLSNQEGPPRERDVVVVIPGRDRRRAVIMADHYDTAYMEDRYEKEKGGSGVRLAAAGADDNHSATAALMLGAEVFLDLSRAGKLGCDIWLVHLTGEEFPADCLGARHLCQQLVQGTLRLRLKEGDWHDLSRVRIQGVYVLDMVAHNNDHDRDIFQIAPGTGPESLWLAYQAHLANEAWNAGAARWNRRPSRRDRQRGRRSRNGKTIPDVALHPILSGEVRPCYDPRSTLFNTDGQIFSDAGVPVVLFMENYDINRTGYHDTHDTMANIDLDYGAALSAIAIEAVARAATHSAAE